MCGYKQRSSHTSFNGALSGDPLKLTFSLTNFTNKLVNLNAALISPRQSFKPGNYCVKFTYECNFLQIFKETEKKLEMLFEIEQKNAFLKTDFVELDQSIDEDINLVFLIKKKKSQSNPLVCNFESIEILNEKCSEAFFKKRKKTDFLHLK